MAEFLYLLNEQHHGPVSLKQLEEWVATGQLSNDCLVWKEGMAQWEPLSSINSIERLSTVPANVGTRLKLGTAMDHSSMPEAEVVCSVCQHFYPPARTIRHGASTVCSICKDQFFANLSAHTTQADAVSLAPRWKRFVAYFVDFLVTVVLLLIALKISDIFDPAFRPAHSKLLLLLALKFGLALLSVLAYFTFLVGFSGQTLGKKLLRIRVVRMDGSHVSYPRAAARILVDYAGKLIPLFWLASLVMVFFDEKRRMIHDYAAGTVVVKA